jgi:excisionase family DNA binding protein
VSNAKKPPIQALLENPTVSVEECARQLGLSRNGCYSAVKENHIPHFRVGRSIRVPSAPLREMLGLQEPKSEPRREDRSLGYLNISG